MTGELHDTFDLITLKSELTEDEGRKLKLYQDTLGLPTIGIGRELSQHGLSDSEVDMLFANDVRDCCDTMDRNIPWWRGLPPNAQRVMINLCFMGWGNFRTFVHFLDAMQRHDFQTAAAELANSRWWEQVKTRGPRVRDRLLGAPQPTT